MNLSEQRAIALSAVRGHIRACGFDPLQTSAHEAHVFLDELARAAPDLVASQWYAVASSAQMQQFYQEWEAWRRSHQQELRVSEQFQRMMNRLLPLE